MARKDTKIDQLSQVRLFASLSKRELATIGRAAEEIDVPPGRVLCEEGKAGHEFFLILDGEATVRRNGRKVATLQPTMYFGELALLTRHPRNSTIVADTPMSLLVLGTREFAGLLDEIPGLAHKMLTAMAERLSEADAKQL